MDGESGVVRLNDSVRDLGRGNDGESGHHSVGELLTDLGDQQSTHTGTGTTTERVGDLETLEAVAAFGLTTDDIEDLVNQFGTLSVMTLGPVVASTRLTEDEVVRAEKLTERTGTDSIHGTGLEIDENSARNILVARSLCTYIRVSWLAPPCRYTAQGEKSGVSKTHLVEVDAHTLELELRGTVVNTIAVEAVLARDGLPESSTNLVTLSRHCELPTPYFHRSKDCEYITYALTGLEVNL